MKTLFYSSIASLALFYSCGKKTEETKPIRKDVTETVFASGILEAKNTYNLTAQTDGYLVSINFKEGDVVQKGAVLAVIDNKENSYNKESSNELYEIAQKNLQSNAPSLLQAKNNITIAKNKMEQDRIQEQRYKSLLQSNSIARNDYEVMLLNYQTSKANYDNAIETYKKLKQDAQQQVIINKASKQINATGLGKNAIRAVVSGRVYEKMKETGDFVRKGDVIAKLGDASVIYAKVNVDESNIAKVALGQEAAVVLNTNKNKVYKGTVSEILPSFNDVTQSFTCKITFIDALDFNIVNTQLQTNIVVGVQKNALLIPRNYIDFGGKVQVKDKKGKTQVTTNFIGGEWVQILSGIDENTVLVTDNLVSNEHKTSEAGASMPGP
jgi:HlyD family secretion protein